MPSQTKLSSSPQETFDFGFKLAEQLPLEACLLISGPLGAGKTQLIKGICAYFKIPETAVQSPTYSLHHIYQGTEPVHHFDLYRLKNAQEFLERGFSDILETAAPICIEWPEKVDPLLFKRKKKLYINVSLFEDHTRKIELVYD